METSGAGHLNSGSSRQAGHQMRILVVHNHYGHFATGGEGQVALAEAELLRSHGHIVSKYEATNSEIEELSLVGKCQSLLQVGWSKVGYERISTAIDEFQPDLMHVHNYWFRLTPSVFAAAKEHGVATVLTLHNYRLACPAGQFLRKAKPCELCMDGMSWRVLIHRCYSGGSFLKSLLAYRLYQETRKRQFLASLVDSYIALTEFGKHKAVAGGLPPEKLYVKPNFMADPLNGGTPTTPKIGAIYVGRISPEKGVLSLLAAWRYVDYPLTIVGDGPQMPEAQKAAASQVKFLGNRSHEEVLRLIEQSAFLVFPSEWYESFGLTLLESMAVGRAVVASDLGPRREIVRDGQTGLLYRSRDIQDLKSKVRRLISDRNLCAMMGAAAREVYLAEYTPSKNYQMLMKVYEESVHRNRHYRRDSTSVGGAVPLEDQARTESLQL
jgi:glycosyltransferase involved in cell wall biosynthesis